MPNKEEINFFKCMVNKRRKEKKTQKQINRTMAKQGNFLKKIKEKKNGKSTIVDDLYSMPPSLVAMHAPQLPSFCETLWPPLNLLNFEYFCHKCMFVMPSIEQNL